MVTSSSGTEQRGGDEADVTSGELVVAEEHAGKLRVLRRVQAPLGVEVVIGRDTYVTIGADPPDSRVSREAARVIATPEGWRVLATNRNGVMVYPWAQPGRVAAPVELLRHEFVALRVVGHADRKHWLLLEGQQTTALAGRPTVHTEIRTPPRALTGPQLEVLGCLFGELLAWPPVVGSEPLQLKQVARQLGVSLSAVQARLVEVRAKAEWFGLARHAPLTDPEYLYALVGAQFFRASDHVRRRA